MNIDEAGKSLLKKLTQELKLVGINEVFSIELTEQYNEDYRHFVTGFLIKHTTKADFCIFVASLNDAEMRRAIDSGKTYKSIVTGVWTPYLEPKGQIEWINEYEFSADDVFEAQDDAIMHVTVFIQERLDSIK